MKLTWKEGYQAVYGLLDGIWDGVASGDQKLLSELDTFLGGMMLQEDDTSADPLFLNLWHEAVAQVTRGGGWGDLTAEDAYRAMLLFLEPWAKDRSDGTILWIWEDLSRSGPEREDWTEAVQKVKEGEFDPYFGLTEEECGDTEVRATLIYLVNGDMVLTKRPYTLYQEIQAEYTGYQSSQMSLTCEEMIDFFFKDWGDEENWPIYKADILEFFESDDETVRFVKE